jgi:hypothetical protein
MRLRITLFAALLGVSLPAAQAQEREPSTAEVAARVQEELRCVQSHRAELDRIEHLLSEARAQLMSPSAREPERRDAARSVEALEERVAEAGRALAGCVEASRSARREAEEAREADVAIAEPRSSLDSRAVSGPESLTSAVQVVRGLQVDGTGRIAPDAVARAVRRVARPLDRCYARMVDVGALTSGELDVTFHVTPDGRTLGHAVEGSNIGNPEFERCVLRVARQIDVGAPALGGDAGYSFTLHFGPRRTP